MFVRLSTILIAATLAFGQAPAARQAAMQRMEQISAQLNLTETQKEKIMPILIEEAPKVQAIKSNASLPQNEKIAKMLEVRNETTDQIKPLLTSKQQQKLDQMRAQERQHVIQELRSGKG